MPSLYDESLEWLYGTQQFGIKLGLENVTKLIESLELPDSLRNRKILHVAGTNGKGSVCAFSERILRDGGLTTGLFTSPHLIAYPERIRVDGIPADEESLGKHLARIRERVADWDPHPTFFEITLATGLLVFCESDCGVIILETGMGGRLDATNCLKADVSVITQVAMDHQQWLGDDLRSIAAEKAGILKEDVPVIVPDLHPEVRDVIGRRALQLGIPFIEAHPIPEDWTPGLAGSHQRENAALAVEAACRIEQDSLTLEGIRRSLERTSWPGRFQRIGEKLVLDGAHNVAAAETLARTWGEIFGEEKASLIFGAANSKDVAGILSHLGSISERVSFVPIRSERRLTTEEMKEGLAGAGFGELETEEFDSLSAALAAAESRAGKTLVAGSLFLDGEALALTGEQVFEESLQ